MLRFLSLFLFTLLVACGTKPDTPSEPKTIITDQYELLIAPGDKKGTLILFGGYGEHPNSIKAEFKIDSIAMKNDISLILMNYNQRLWLEDEELEWLEQTLQQITEENDLNTSNLFLGGFSSGGNVALLLANYLTRPGASLSAKGVFAVDAPVDLYDLRAFAERDLQKNKGKTDTDEAEFLAEVLDTEFGQGDTAIMNYVNKSPFVDKTGSFQNLENLKDIKLRLYTEPDTTWWREYRNMDYIDVNAYRNEGLVRLLKKNGFEELEFIITQNRGYRADGSRHPHSWAIGDVDELVNWMLFN